jgi:hypothetical protein
MHVVLSRGIKWPKQEGDHMYPPKVTGTIYSCRLLDGTAHVLPHAIVSQPASVACLCTLPAFVSAFHLNVVDASAHLPSCALVSQLASVACSLSSLCAPFAFVRASHYSTDIKNVQNCISISPICLYSVAVRHRNKLLHEQLELATPPSTCRIQAKDSVLNENVRSLCGQTRSSQTVRRAPSGGGAVGLLGGSNSLYEGHLFWTKYGRRIKYTFW